MSLLEARKLSVSIGSVVVAENLDWSLETGEIWGLLGRNGVGKTTLMQTLAGIRPADSGEILLDGQPLSALTRRQVARKLGMLTQHTRYAFDASCLETALVGRHPHLSAWARERREDRAMAHQALTEMGLAELAERSCMELSGGETRRLGLATVLVQNPEIFLLDEPVNHLDPANQVEMLDVIYRRAWRQQRAVMMSLHDVNLTTCYCTHLLMLFGDGQWLAGPSQQLLNADNLSRLYQCQVRLVDDGQQQVFAVAASKSGII